MAAAEQFFQSFRVACKNPGYLALLALQFIITVGYQALIVFINLRLLDVDSSTLDKETIAALFTAQNLTILISAIIIEVIIFFAFYFYFQAGTLGMARQIVQKGKAKFSEFPALAMQYWRPIAANQIIIFIAIGVAAIVGFLILLPFLIFSFEGESVATAGFLLLPIAALLGLAMLLIAIILLIFSSAGVFFHQMSGWESFRNGLRSGISQPTTALKVIIGYLCVGIAFLILWTILYIPYFAIFWQQLAAQASTPAMTLAGTTIDKIASLLSTLLFGPVTIFLFSMYKNDIMKSAGKASQQPKIAKRK